MLVLVVVNIMVTLNDFTVLYSYENQSSLSHTDKAWYGQGFTDTSMIPLRTEVLCSRVSHV